MTLAGTRRHIMRTLWLGLFLLAAACSKPAPETQDTKAEPIQKYALHGEVIRLDSKDNLATIKHEKIGDWMGAMTMEFPVKDPQDYAKLHAGDKIDATVFVQGLSFWVGEVQTQPPPN